MSGPWEDYQTGGTKTLTRPWEVYAAAKAAPARGLPVYKNYGDDQPAAGERVSTTAGGPPLRTAGAPGEGAALGAELADAASTPAVRLPRFTIAPDDSPARAVGKEAVNLLAGLAEFPETPEGMPTVALGGLLPRTVATLFTAKAADDIGHGIVQAHKDWTKYTPAQQAAVVTDLAGSGVLAAFMARTAVRGGAGREARGAGPAAEEGPKTTFTADANGNVHASGQTITGKDLNLPKGATPPPGPQPGTAASLRALGYDDVEINRMDVGTRVRIAQAGTRKAVALPSAEELKAAIEGNALKPKETIATPAVKSGDVVTPGPDHTTAEATARADGTVAGPVRDGFVTGSGEFVGREKAAEIQGGPTTVEPGKLHSEDLAIPPAPKAAGRRGVFLVPARSDGVHDILDEVQIHGGLAVPDEAAGGEYDSYQETLRGTAALLRRRSGGLTPDKMVENVQEQFPRIKSPDDLYDSIRTATAEREQLRATGGGPEARTQKFWDTVSQGEAKDLEKVNVDDLQVGQTFRVKAPGAAHDELTVAHIDPDTGEVTVKDGPTFGSQDLPAGAEIYVRKGTVSAARTGQGEAAPWEDFAPEEEETPSTNLQAPENNQAASTNAPGPWEDFAAKAPPAEADQVTLYRAESPTVKFSDVFDPAKLGDFAHADKPGEFWTSDPAFADYMRESYGPDATVRTRTVPKSQAAEWQVSDHEYKIPEGPGRVEGMGSTPRSTPAAVAARASSQAASGLTPGRTGLPAATAAVASAATKRPWFFGLRAAVAPVTLGDAAKATATVLRYMLGQRYRAEMEFDHLMAKFRRAFDTQTTPRNFVYDPAKPLPPNWELQRAIDTGDLQGLTPLETEFATEARKLLDAAIKRVQGVNPNVLTKLHQFYFPRYWREQDEAAAARLAAVNRPFEGPKGFLKQRSLALWDDALKMGLRPRYDNPTDALRSKLGEMEMFASALEAHAFEKAGGRRRFLYIFERMPQNWTQYEDPSTDVFAPPTVTIEEAYDEQIRTKTLEMFQKLGIDQRRLANLGPGRWGEAQERPEQVRTKFGGADFVFWHEFGHIMDFRYPDLRPMLGLTGKGGGKDVLNTELRALADLRGASKSYARKAEEKMANVFDAYVRAPDLFKTTAPHVWTALQTWLAKHPEVAGPLNDIRPSLKLGTGAAEKFVGGPILLGHWIVPVESAAVLNNFLKPGLWAKAPGLAAIKGLGGLISNVRLISAFHGQMVSNDALASGLSLPLYDALRGVAEKNPHLLKRGLGALPFIPFRPVTALVQGGRMLRSVREPGAAVPALDRQLADYAIETNLRAGHGAGVEDATRRWKQLLYETANSWKAGQANVPAVLETLGRTPLMVAHQMMRPIMEWFVPRMKMGLAAPMIQRVVADNPGMDPWELRQKLGKVGDAVEDRVGQVTYDNLFQSKMVKDSGQLALQAYGWHLTKERMLFGAASDYFKAGKAMLQGKTPEVTFRMTYLPALVITHAIIGGTIMYMLTGRRPQTARDYLFPETGLVDAYGRPVRLAMADFLKDYASEWHAAMKGPHALAQEWEGRLAPVWNELAEMWNNRDFFNTKIFSERNFDEPEWQHLWKNLGEGVTYLGSSSAPFSAHGAAIFSRSLPNTPTETQKVLAHFGPYFGFVPAPQSLTMTPAEARAGEIMREGLPPMSKDQSAHVQAISNLVQELRTGKIHGQDELGQAMRAAGVKDNAELSRIAERVSMSPLQYQMHKLPLYQPGTGRDAMSVFDLMNEQERQSSAGILMDKIERAYTGKRLDVDTASRLVRLVLPYAQRAAAAKAGTVQTRGRLRSME